MRAPGLPPGPPQVFDLVLCNPPYVNQASMAALPPEFQAEPSLALAGGADGMDFIRPLLAALPARLSRHGVLILEIGHEKAYFEAAFPSLDPIWLSTSAGDDQVLLLTRDDLLSYLRQVMEIRALEDNISSLLTKGVLKGATGLNMRTHRLQNKRAQDLPRWIFMGAIAAFAAYLVWTYFSA